MSDLPDPSVVGRYDAYLGTALDVFYGRRGRRERIKFECDDEAIAVRDALCERFGVPEGAARESRKEGAEAVVEMFNKHRPSRDELLSLNRHWLATRVTKVEEDLGSLEEWLRSLTEVVQGTLPDGEEDQA